MLIGEASPKSALKHLRPAFGCPLSRLSKNLPIKISDNEKLVEFGKTIFCAAHTEAHKMLLAVNNIDRIEEYYSGLKIEPDSGAPYTHACQVLMTIALWREDIPRARQIVLSVYDDEKEELMKNTIWEAAKEYLSSSHREPPH